MATKDIEVPEGWERTTHCGYPAICKGDTVVYTSPKGGGVVRVRLPKGHTVPTSSRHFWSFAAAVDGE
jgi:hypothetical protein